MFDLVIDARMQSHGGIGTYLQNLLPYLEKSGLKLLKIESKESIYSLREQLMLPLKIPRTALFWSAHFNVPLLPILAKRRLVTLHDFYHLAHLKELSLLQRAYARLFMRAAVQKASRLITISSFTQKELYRFFPSFRGKVDLILLGPGSVATEQEGPEFIEKLPEKFFLFVGNLKPHKNVETLVRAFGQVEGQEHLLIVGKKEGMIRGIDWERLSLLPKVHFMGQVKGGELRALYRRATALIFPSFYEGWGLPPIEAMAQGCPVIASRAASIPEACGEAAQYFDPHSVDELVSLLRSVSDWRAEFILKGKKQAEKFSWQKCAERHLEVIREEIEAASL